MKYRFFYTDYCEGKSIPGTEPWEVDKAQILHSMDCVLHMPDNFLGILNDKDQCLQFRVNKDRSIQIDIPILRNGLFAGSKTTIAPLRECLSLVSSLDGSEDFPKLLPEDTFDPDDTFQKSKPNPK